MSKQYTYQLKNLTCANCANKIEQNLAKQPGFERVVMNFNTTKLIFESDETHVKEKVEKMIHSLEPDVEVLEVVTNNSVTINYSPLLRIVVGIIFGIYSLLLEQYNIVSLVFVILSYLILLPRTLKKATQILVRGKQLDENALIVISVFGAFLIGESFEGFMVIALYEIGKFLEEIAVNRSKQSITDLMDIQPMYANVKQEGEVVRKSPEQVSIGDILIIKLGEKVPVDGVVIQGETYLDMMALTGESKPFYVKEGDSILSGSINTTQLIEIEVRSQYENSAVCRILDLVENATNRKAKSENFVSKAAKIYTPIIIILAILTAILFPLFTNISVTNSIYRALSFLVISCPCAIAISVPLSYFAGIGLSSKRGILIKGSDYLDQLRKIKTIVFDKTGTLTTGRFELLNIDVKDDSYSEEQLLELCAYGESFSNHPIAKSIVKTYEATIDKERISEYKEIPGVGISYIYEEKQIIIGKPNETVDSPNTVVEMRVDEAIVGRFEIGDEVKQDAKRTIHELQKRDIQTIMFTGDQATTAQYVASALGIIEVKSSLLPDQKYQELEILLHGNQSDGCIAFVGDGINDAPVLMRADIGISMGSIGSASAIEASDVVLMTDEVDRITEAIAISKKTATIVKQNLIFSIGVKLLFIVLNLFGLSTMAWAVFADVGVTLIAILNSIRILKFNSTHLK